MCFLQHTYSLVFCFTDEEGSYSTNGRTFGSQHNPQFRIFAFKCLRKMAKNDYYFIITVRLSLSRDQLVTQWMVLVDFDIRFFSKICLEYPSFA